MTPQTGCVKGTYRFCFVPRFRAAWLALAMLIPGSPGVAAGAAEPALRVVRATQPGVPLLHNGGFEELAQGHPAPWRKWQQGFQAAAGQGRGGSSAIVCERTEAGGEWGASQTIALNRTNLAPLVIRGWSKAANVGGSADSGYSLYIDIVYQDNTPLWGRTGNFRCGTHDWEEREFILLPEKPVKTITLHCLFRGHTGKVWFDDVSLEEIPTPSGAVLLHGSPVEPARGLTRGARSGKRPVRAGDGLELGLDDDRVSSLRINGRELAAGSPSGFLARDFKEGSDYFEFGNDVCANLGLRLQARYAGSSNHIAIEGRVTDTSDRDRAVTLLFALPVDAAGWQWGDDLRRSRAITGTSEFANTVAMRSGAAGRMSRYPLAAIWNATSGLGLGLDMEHPLQYSIVCHPGTRQFFIAFDVALVKDTAKFPSSADFRFVLFNFDPVGGFRAALQKYYDIFPAHFARRVTREGVWMPFTDIARVPGFEDFGFAFQEGAPNVAFDDAHNIASFVYVEPMSYWLALPEAAPRTYDSAVSVLHEDLAGGRDAEKKRMAAATLISGIHTADSQFALYLVKAPWCDGGVFTLNPDPEIVTNSVHPFNKATAMLPAIEAAFARNQPKTNATAAGAGLDGLYYDSLEMSGAELNYRRDHFRTADIPLVFDSAGRPCQLMIFNTLEFVRATAAGLHARGRLTFANAVLWNYSLPVTSLDVLGTEVNWLHNGEYQADSDAVMNFRRALCRQKPYCLLMNTDYSKFTPAMVERYFERCLFYGVWPGFFDQEAASKDPYWASEKKWYERDRALFKKYIPLLRCVTAAGWEPLSLATVDDPGLWLERFGSPAPGNLYLTVFNSTDQSRRSVVTLEAGAARAIGPAPPRDLVSGTLLKPAPAGWEIELGPQRVAVLHWAPAP